MAKRAKEGPKRSRTQGSNINKKSTINNEFAVITYFFLAIFILMIGYFVYFMVLRSAAFINSPFNRRQDLFAETVIKGEIRSADGRVLAETITNNDGSETRRYPYNAMFAHAVGYDMANSRSGIESFANFDLLRSHAFFVEQIINGLYERKNPGDNLISTLEFPIQEAAFNALGSNRGAIIVMEPATGKILAWVSKPDFNPNTIARDWDGIVSDPNSTVLLNRVSQGLYPPGSTFKTLTSLEYLREHLGNPAYSYHCTGNIDVDGNVITCFRGTRHGDVDLSIAFARSCNTAFVNMGLVALDPSSFEGLSRDMLFDTSLPVDYPSSPSQFALSNASSNWQIAQTSIGQGETLMTPLHMNMITCAIANDGKLMRPYVIDRVENYKEILVRQNEPSAFESNLLSDSEVRILQELMSDVVKSGTGTSLQSGSYSAAGKTGSAEFVRGSSHAWFTGYATSSSRKTIALTVIVEGGGTGGEAAVPIAERIFDLYFK